MFYFLIALIAGITFGLGMAISGMIVPNNVLSFLSIFEGWNPSLMFVIGGALLVFMPVYQFGIKNRQQPVLTDNFCVNQNKDVDNRLVIGSIIFGIGWGVLGVCPGPVVSSLFLGNSDVYWFVIAMIGGFMLVKFLETNRGETAACEVQ